MDNVYEDLMDFLGRSSDKYSASLNDAKASLIQYSGDFWNDSLMKRYRRRDKKRINLAMNNWNVMVNAISSKYSKSPWHIQLDEDDDALQDLIDAFEQDNDNKNAILEAFRTSVITGYGYIAVTFDETSDGEIVPVLEPIKDLSLVAFDPEVETASGKDAEEGAVLSFISKRKAKRLYDLEFMETREFATKFEQWGDHSEQIPVISYFRKNEHGTIDYIKYVGNVNVMEKQLPISRIPIIRFAGIDKYTDDGFAYKGIVEDTFSLVLGINIAYSTLIERCNRSPKANFIANVDAIDGLENYYAQAGDEDSALVLYKGEHQPVAITEQFQTADLTSMIDSCRNLIQDVAGIPLTGIQADADQTATEVLQQETNRVSNQSVFYNHAYDAVRLIGRIVTESLSGGQPAFKLLNGPDTINHNLERRGELTYISKFVPDSVKPLMAVYAADTIASSAGAEIKRNLIANLPTELKMITDERTDANAMHQLNQMAEALSQSQETINELQRQIIELNKEKDDYYKQLMEGREQRQLDWSKFKIQTQMDAVKNEQANEVANKKLELEAAKAISEAETERQKTIAETNETIAQELNREAIEQ